MRHDLRGALQLPVVESPICVGVPATAARLVLASRGAEALARLRSSTPSSSTGTSHCTSGRAGTLPCTTRISGSKARPLDGERDRRGGLRERTVHSVDPLGSPECDDSGLSSCLRGAAGYGSTPARPRSASVDPSRERPDDRERPGGPLRIARAHGLHDLGRGAMEDGPVGTDDPGKRSPSRPVVTNRAKPAHPRARDDREPALLRACLH